MTNFIEIPGIRGDICVRSYYTDTGVEVEPDFTQKNVILSQGITAFFKAFGESSNASFAVDTIKIGSDVGDGGTISAPIAATSELTETDQTVVYSTPAGEFFVTYPTANQISFLATINGANVMAEYPSQPNVYYTSAAIYNKEGTAIAYKRFAARTISSLISVDISWTITLTAAAS